MAAPKKAASKEAAISVEPLEMTEIDMCILGVSPMIFNRQSAKVQRELLLPAAAKNRASRRVELKHDPLREYRDSVYADASESAPTRLFFPAPAFKAAAMTAALETPGTTKSSIGRLLQVVGYSVRIWGQPQLFMCGVRQAGMNRTPDIRTRAILPEWATMIKVRYPSKSIEPASVANLFAAAGQLCGIGDFRQEKGKGSFGLYQLVNEDHPDFRRIIDEQGREVQDAALANPEPFNDESASLLSWFEEEVVRRGRGSEVASAQPSA